MNRTRIVIGVMVGLIVAVGGVAWWLGYFSDSPDEVTIDAAAEAASAGGDDGTGNDATDSDDGSGTESDNDTEADADETAAAEGITGTWTVQPDEDVTFVGYRINEVLTTIGDFEVVGRTSDVTGTVEVDGTTISEAALVARMDTLTTDNDRRDRAMQSQALETADFPEANFILTSPIELDGIPSEGETISVNAAGDLTVHGVTQAVNFPLEAQLVGGSMVVVGQLQVLLADFDIDAPSAPIVASVEDTAILELSLTLDRS